MKNGLRRNAIGLSNYILVLALGWGLLSGIISTPVFGQETPRVMIVLDASGSMRGQIGGRTKMDIARDTLSTVLSEIPQETEIGLIAYGHRQRGSCTDIETLVSFGPARRTVPQILRASRAIRPVGMTPLTDAVRLAAEELTYGENKATVILVTDGIETCKADPCALGRELERDGVDFTAHVVGFGMTRDEGRQVACLAENTGGKYVSADNADELTDALRDLVSLEPEPEPEPVIQARTVHFSWRDVRGGPHLNSRAFKMDIRALDNEGEAPTDIRLWHHERPYSAEATMMPGRYVALVQRLEDRGRSINARIEFEVVPGHEPLIIDRVISARLRIDGVLTANGDVKTRNLHAAHGGSDPRFAFTLYPVENGAVSVAHSIGVIHSNEIALAPGHYLVHGSAPGFRREKLVNVPPGETTVLRFDFDLAEVFVELNDRDGFPRKRPLDLVFETMEGTTWNNQTHIVEGRGTRNNRPAPYLLPTGMWRIKSYDEGSPRPVAETIIEVSRTDQPITLRLRDGQTPDPEMLSRFVDEARVGCIQRVGGPSNCLVEAVTPEQIDQISGVDPIAADRERARTSFDGTWITTEGTIALVREGRRVVGEWTARNQNRIEARLSGDLRTIRGSWASLDGQSVGLFEARLSDDGTTFSGSWSRDDRLPSGSRWQGRRVSYGTPEFRDNPPSESRFPDRLANSAGFRNFISEVEREPDQLTPASRPERRTDASDPGRRPGMAAPRRVVAGSSATRQLDFTNDATGEPALSIIFNVEERPQRGVVLMFDRWCGGDGCPATEMPIVGHPFAFQVVTKGGSVAAQSPDGGPYFAIVSKDLFGDRSVPAGTIKLSVGPTEVDADLRPIEGTTREIATFTGRLAATPAPDERATGVSAGDDGVTPAAGPSGTASSGGGWLTPVRPAAPEPPGMSCDELKSRVAELMFSTNIAQQQLLIGIGEREGFAGGPPTDPADCARLARAFSAGGVRAFADVAPSGRRSEASPEPAPAFDRQRSTQPAAPAERVDILPSQQLQAGDRNDPISRTSVIGSWAIERTGFKAVVTVVPTSEPPPTGSYPQVDVTMHVESRPGDGCPKEPAWQAICRNVHHYGSYVGQGQVSAGAVVPGNAGRYLTGQLIGDVMLPIQISFDRGSLWVSVPKGEAFGDLPRSPSGWYNLRFAAVDDQAQASADGPAISPRHNTKQDGVQSIAAFPGDTIWAVIENEADIARITDRDRIERCRRDPRIGFGDGVLVHRRENPNWRLGIQPGPGNPGPFVTLNVRECDRSGDLMECLEKPISPTDGQPMADLARILQFRVEPHAQSGGVRVCPVNSRHLAGGRQCGIFLACSDTELDVVTPDGNLLDIVTEPVFGYPPRIAPPSQTASAAQNSEHGAAQSQTTNGAKWSCLYVNGQIALVNDAALRSGPTRNEALFEKVMRTLRTKGFMRADQAWGANPPTDQATCDRLGDAMSEAGIPGFEMPNAGTISSCGHLRAVGMAVNRQWDKFGITQDQRNRALDLPASLDNPDWTAAQCRAVGEHWVTIGLPGLVASAVAPAPENAAQPKRDRDARSPATRQQRADPGAARAVSIIQDLYSEHIRRSNLGGSIFDNVEVATRWGFARPVATAIVRNLARIGSDPIFDAQDFEITQLRVTLDPNPGPAGRIAVLANFRNFGKPTRLRYILHDAGQGPEIVDIEAKGWHLRKLLNLR